jgi:hypothetical protein
MLPVVFVILAQHRISQFRDEKRFQTSPDKRSSRRVEQQNEEFGKERHPHANDVHRVSRGTAQRMEVTWEE